MPRARSLAAVLSLLPGIALAHAILTKASLEGTVRAGTPTAVTLQFNSRIELEVTKVVLVNAAGEEQPLAITPASGPGAFAVSLPALAPGAYGLRYKVLAADGHVTESILRFRVDPAE